MGEKRRKFQALVSEAAACVRCPAMCERTAVLSDLNGPIDARVMFIGEAPGRKGADRTRRPFSGDQSGKNFERFLTSINLQRADIFITSARQQERTADQPRRNCETARTSCAAQ